MEETAPTDPAATTPPVPEAPKKGEKGFFRTLRSRLTDKQQQQAKIIIVVTIFIACVLGLTKAQEVWRERSKARMNHSGKTADSTGRPKMTLLNQRVERDLWVAAEGQNIKAIEQTTSALRDEMTQLKAELEKSKKEIKISGVPPPAVKVPIPPPPVPGSPVGQPVQAGQSVPRPPNTLPAAGAVTITNAPGAPGTPGAPGALSASVASVKPTIRIIEDDTRGKIGDSVPTMARKREKDAWLPTGSFFKVVLLNGIDAPTSGGAQSEPYPVLMNIQDIATLPNRFKMDMKECFVIGAGFGNISDERAYIRTERLSCIRRNGEAVDFDLTGHIIGEDGKLGLRGRIVSKQGQQIAMSLFAGTLAGLGQALKPTGTVKLDIGESTSTNVQRNSFGDVMSSAGLGGAGGALERVAQYYLKMAERTFPIIEIDAGRTVEVVVLKGRSLKPTTSGNTIDETRSNYDQSRKPKSNPVQPAQQPAQQSQQATAGPGSIR